MSIVLHLPIPPSVNNLYRSVPGRGRVKTGRYERWINDAGWLLRSQRPGSIKGAYTVEMVFPLSRHDLGNLEKGVSDLLQAHRVIENDKYCREIRLSRDPCLKDVRVTVKAFEEPSS